MKTDDGAKVAAVFTVMETKYLMVGKFHDLVVPFSIYFCDVKYFDHAICLGFGMMRKKGCAISQSHAPFSGCQLSHFRAQVFYLGTILQICEPIVLFWFNLKLEIVLPLTFP